MATTSLWSVKGWLSKVLIYAENPDKTENASFYAMTDATEEGLQRLDDVIAYAADEVKTHKQHFVSGVNVNPNTARDEMMLVKKQFAKTDGTVAYHGYQSFAKGETTPEVAHEIGVKLAQRLWGEEFQVLIATHTDRGHLHNHFIINTVSMIDGHKFYRSNSDYQKMKDTSDALCKEACLSVIEKPNEGRSKHYGEWKAEKENKPTWRSLIKSDVDEAIERATSTSQFFTNLKNLGYEIKTGKDISVRPPGKERFVRLVRSFGEDYSEEAIKRRILAKSTPQLTIPKGSSYQAVNTELPPIAKGSVGETYRQYCYLFGVYENKGSKAERMPFALREERRNFNQITEDEKLLNREGIETEVKLAEFRASHESNIALLVRERRRLQIKDRKLNGGIKPDIPNPRIDEINKVLKVLRKEVKQCTRIAERSSVLEEKLARLEVNPTKTREEVIHGRNRTSNRSTRKSHIHGK